MKQHVTRAAIIIAVTLSASTPSAQTFFVQGEDGSDGPVTCVADECTLDASLAPLGDLTVQGQARFDTLTVDGSYAWPECPQGYTRLTSCTECNQIVVCRKDLAGGYDEMVKVGNFWIDRYEASVWQTAECNGTQYGQSSDDYGVFPDNGNWAGGQERYACSLAAVLPATWITWFQAQQACHLAGKRLCTSAEWQAAAAGTHDPGASEVAYQCRVDSANTDPRLTGQAGDTVGGSDSCISVWGAEDMIGNVEEWVDDWVQAGDTWTTAGGTNETVAVWGSGFGNDSTWNVNGNAYHGGYIDGMPAAMRRGGTYMDDSDSGIYWIDLASGPGYNPYYGGMRCCMSR